METHEILLVVGIKTDHPIPARKPHLVIITRKRKNLPSGRFCRSSEEKNENKRTWNYRQKYMDCIRELKKLWNMKVSVLLILLYTLGTITKCFEKRLWNLDIRVWIETTQTIVIKISLNTTKSPGDQRRYAVTQISVGKPLIKGDIKKKNQLELSEYIS